MVNSPGSLTMNNFSMIFKNYIYSSRRDIRMLTESIQANKMSVAKNLTRKPLLIINLSACVKDKKEKVRGREGIYAFRSEPARINK